MELFENDETVRKSQTEAKRTPSTRGDGRAEKENAAGEQAVGAGRQESRGQKSRRTVAVGATEAAAPEDTEPPGGTRSVDPMPARGRAASDVPRTPQPLQKRVPSTSMRSRTWRWVPRRRVEPMEGRNLPDQLEGVDGSKDDQGVSRRGGHGLEPMRGLEPSTWRRWPDVQPAAPVNVECPRNRAVESLVQPERGQWWLDEFAQGLRLSGGLWGLLHRCIRFMFIQGGRVARDLGMVDVDDRLIVALDSLRGHVWSWVL